MSEFVGWNVPALQHYLEQRGVSFSGKRKEDLLQICQACRAISLPIDPDFRNVDSSLDWKDKLRELNIELDIEGFTNDLSHLPPIGLYDIFNYLLETRTDYDRKKLKAYKSADDFRLFSDGAVEDLVYSMNGDHELGIVKAKVKPTQKKKTYSKESTYSVWLAVKKDAGTVVLARCVCPGGSDGACRHVGAVLYELESYQDRVKTCTDIPVPWIRRARQTDEPVPISQLTIRKPSYQPGPPLQERNSTYDPRHPFDRREATAEELQNFTAGIQNVAPNSCCLPALADPVEDEHLSNSPTAEALQMSVMERIDLFLYSLPDGDHDNDSMFSSFSTSLCANEVSRIHELTLGQGSNPNWLPLRKGRITASNAKRVASRVKTLQDFPDSNTTPLLHALTSEGNDLSHISSIAWGHGQEPKARKKYALIERRRHKKLCVKEAGLIVSKQNCLLACTPDGIVSCRCSTHGGTRDNDWLVEIKCPSRGRNMCPKRAALDFCGVERVGNSYALKRDHQYYTQVQMQLGLLEMTMCDLVVYTKQGLHVVNVPFDGAFYADLISNLNLFAKEYLFPHLLALRFFKG